MACVTSVWQSARSQIITANEGVTAACAQRDVWLDYDYIQSQRISLYWHKNVAKNAFRRASQSGGGYMSMLSCEECQLRPHMAHDPLGSAHAGVSLACLWANVLWSELGLIKHGKMGVDRPKMSSTSGPRKRDTLNSAILIRLVSKLNYHICAWVCLTV